MMLYRRLVALREEFTNTGDCLSWNNHWPLSQNYSV